MKTAQRGETSHRKSIIFARAMIVAGFFFAAANGLAQGLPGGGGGGSGPTYTPLDSWSFSDHTNWTSDNGYFPLSFTNLAYSQLGNFQSLVVDTNVPALLQYRVVETNGTTNLTVNLGTVTFWFAPGSWSGTNAGGTGPGEYGRLFETGAYTTNSSYGWWSLYVDPAGANLYFSAQTNDSSGTFTNYLAVPVSWTTNYFHFIALTYSATNTALYLDGALATNGPPVTVYPGQNALTNGFFVGSDSSGVYQAHGLFNSVVTYNVPLDAGTIQGIFNEEYPFYMMNPYNSAMETIGSGSFSPSFTGNNYDAISGAGNLQWDGYAATCSYGTNAFNVWITNISATNAGNGTMNVTFTIEGGADGYVYDVFAGGYLTSPLSNSYWAWLGQGYHCSTYTVNINSRDVFLILGTPQDTSGSGLTDAYEQLVMEVNPDGSQTDSYGVPYAWYAEQRLHPFTASMGGQDPDHDGLLNYQEYQFGTRPLVSEGSTIWVSTPNGTSGIP